jgi:hypothetical protein
MSDASHEEQHSDIGIALVLHQHQRPVATPEAAALVGTPPPDAFTIVPAANWAYLCLLITEEIRT